VNYLAAGARGSLSGCRQQKRAVIGPVGKGKEFFPDSRGLRGNLQCPREALEAQDARKSNGRFSIRLKCRTTHDAKREWKGHHLKRKVASCESKQEKGNRYLTKLKRETCLVAAAFPARALVVLIKVRQTGKKSISARTERVKVKIQGVFFHIMRE